MKARIAAFVVWALAAAGAVYWALRLLAAPAGLPPSVETVSMAGALKGDIARLFASPASAPDATPMVAEPALASRFKLIGVVAGKPQGFADVVIEASIKTHVAGYYSNELETSLHGKPGYPFMLNIDGQVVVWKVDGKKDVDPAYDELGNTSRDPEAGTGVSYILERKIRLQEGAHKVYFLLPEDDYIADVVIALRSGQEAVLEFKPLYWHKNVPYHIPTFLKGVRKYEIYLNGARIN